MAHHEATIIWNRNDDNFLDRKFRRAHEWHFDGGAVVAGSAAPTVLRPPLSDPAAVDPEEALVAALSSCHMLFYLALAAKAGFRIDSYEDRAVGELGKNEEGRTGITRIVLRPAIVFSGEKVPTPEEENALHEEAHSLCYIANSIRSEVVVEAVQAAAA
jgi:organic hydroperoxide reductase OsmC/OhrA